MTGELFNPGEPYFAELIIRSLDGSITAEQFSQLDHEITVNSEARKYYLEFITTYVGLVDLAGVLPKAAEFFEKKTLSDTDLHTKIVETTPSAKKHPDSKTVVDKIRLIERYAEQQLKIFLAQEHRDLRESQYCDNGWDFAFAMGRVAETAEWLFRKGVGVAKAAAVCSLVAAVILIAALYVYKNRTVATLVDSVDAKWNVEIEKDGRIRPRNMSLEQGYARIVLTKGTEVILQAPSTFKVQTGNRLFIDNGWITAKVPVQAIGFEVKTPASSVVDYGTEFGLLVGANYISEVHIFDGKVELAHQGRGTNAGTGQFHQMLTRGEAATVDTSGRFDRSALTDRSRLFVRTMPTGSGFGIAGKRLDLADMIGGGNGLGTGILWQGINPSTGEITPTRTVVGGLDHGFTEAPSLLFVDGVFIPDSNDGTAVISSTGVIFENCPKTLGKCYETVTNGAMFRAGSLELHFGRLAGRIYGTKDSPSIGMHPNAGITFDMDKIRSSMPQVSINRFRTLCGISETAVTYAERDSDPNKIAVDFWVLIDGKTRFHKKLGAVPSQAEQIDIPIDSNDRFLTLATTNPGNYLYCWSMFAEPMLELMKK
jgi:hypothetical protein